MLIDSALDGLERRARAAAELIDATVAMAADGVPLMKRVVPDAGYRVWDHYPIDDAVDARTGARWFYHAHPPEERDAGEHGHFHLFLDRENFFPRRPRAKPLDPDAPDAGVVHIAALSIDFSGLPTKLFTVNRWVTDEWLYDATAIIERLPTFDLSHARDGDPLVNRWLTAAVATFAPEIERILHQRDAALSGAGPAFFEDRAHEILSATAIDLQSCVTEFER